MLHIDGNLCYLCDSDRYRDSASDSYNNCNNKRKKKIKQRDCSLIGKICDF